MKQAVPTARATAAQAHAAARGRGVQPASLGPHACVQQEAGAAGGVTAQVNSVVGSPGRPIDAAARIPLNRRFGHDFSRVRLHTDGAAAESAQAAGALAYTLGSHIVFGPGSYAPATPGGQRLMAHELAHVVQQTSRGEPAARWNNGAIAPPSSPFEQAADKAGAAALADSAGAAPASELALSNGWVAPGAPVLQRQAAPSKPKEMAEEQAPRPAPPDAWNKVEPVLDQELVNTYVEVGRIAARKIDNQVQQFFQPYDDELQADATFLDIITIASGGAANSLADKLSDYASLSGGIGGALAQAVQVFLPRALQSKRVDEAKQKIKDGVADLEDHEFTRNSEIFKSFEKGSMDQLQKEFDKWWAWYDRVNMGVSEADVSVMVPIWRDNVREEFGADSKASLDVIADLQKGVADYLAPLKKELNRLRDDIRRKRYKTYGRAGAVVGGLIGTALGAGLSGGNFGYGVAGALLGALGGAAAGLATAGIVNIFSKKAEDKEVAKGPKEESK
jgi:hypothetical protein